MNRNAVFRENLMKEDSAIPTVGTHWSRILYYDFFRTPTGGSTPHPYELGKRDPRPEASSDFTISSYSLHRAARALRSFILGKIIVAAMEAAGALARRAHARHRQHRQAKAIYDALRELDDRTLHDLGFHRSEITSVAAELTGAAEYTRVRALSDGARFSERSSGSHDFSRKSICRVHLSLAGQCKPQRGAT